MSYLGDMQLGSTINFQFTTVGTSGLPTQLAATTATTISIYPNSSTTQITAGATLTTDFDGITGLNAVSIALTGGNGFATATDYGVALATGTVGGTNVIGYLVANFSIENRFVNKIGTGAITSAVFASGAIVSTTFVAGAITSSVMATSSIPSSIKKNAASRLSFTMTDSVSHNPVTGKTVAGQVSIDGAAFVATNTVNATEISNGDYTLPLAAADTNGNALLFRFTATGCDDLNIFVITQP